MTKQEKLIEAASIAQAKSDNSEGWARTPRMIKEDTLNLAKENGFESTQELAALSKRIYWETMFGYFNSGDTSAW